MVLYDFTVRSVPMDFKDFHIQFGREHHSSLINCLTRRLKFIRDSSIRQEYEYVLDSLRDELSRGIMCFNDITEEHESYDQYYYGLSEDEKKRFHYESVADKRRKRINSKFEFNADNGIISGWKLTSIMGSIYNCTTSYYLNYWHLRYSRLVPTNYIVQGDDTHFKCRFLTQGMYHIGLVNAIGKIAHPDKQFFSTTMTEFLKKSYMQAQDMMFYSPCRIIPSLLFEKHETNSNNTNGLKDIIDIWNLFLVRIPNESRIRYIKEMNYAAKAIRISFKFYNEGVSTNQVSSLFSTPTRINKALIGPLAEPHLIFDDDPQSLIGFKIKDSYTLVKINGFIRTKKAEDSNGWKGIRCYVGSLTKKISRLNQEIVVGALQQTIFNTISEGMCSYTKPAVFGTFVDQATTSRRERYTQLLDSNQEFTSAICFINENILLFLSGVDIATPFAQLMMMNGKLTKEMKKHLTDTGCTPQEIYLSLSSMSSSCKFTMPLFNSLIAKLDIDTLFRFALSDEDYKVSITKHIQHDEYLGLYSQVYNESLAHIIATISRELPKSEIPKLVSFLQIVLEIYAYKNYKSIFRFGRAVSSDLVDIKPFNYFDPQN